VISQKAFKKFKIVFSKEKYFKRTKSQYFGQLNQTRRS